MELEKLKALIREAFSDVPYPGDDNIAGCSRSASPIGCDECDGIAAYFKGTTWQEHTPQSLMGCDSALTMFHDEARHYYLPAFLLAELDDPAGDYIPNVYESIAWNYRPTHPTYFGAYQQERADQQLNLLSESQRKAVSEYFKYHSWDVGD